MCRAENELLRGVRRVFAVAEAYPALKADASGVADAHFKIAGLRIGAGPADIVGRGLIVHALPDDYKTQPTGNSGARRACAVITKVN